jgi:hypothetical protein
MTKYIVHTTFVGLHTYEVEAESEFLAKENYWLEGTLIQSEREDEQVEFIDEEMELDG